MSEEAIPSAHADTSNDAPAETLTSRLRSRGATRWSGDWQWPAGLSELGGLSPVYWHPSIPLFDPEAHDAPTSLRDIDRLIDVLDGPREPIEQPRELYPGDGNIDRLAWYRTFRGSEAWGIFIRDAGIERVAVALTPRGGAPSADARRAGFATLYLHEYAHFLFDVAALTLEEVVGAPLYEAHRASVLNMPPGWHLLTEALCNAFAYRTIHAPGHKRRLRAFLRKSPPGYRDFGAYLSNAAFRDGVEMVLDELLGADAGRPGNMLGGLFGDPASGVGPWIVPVHLVPELPNSQLYAFITALKRVETTSAFDKALDKLGTDVQAAWRERVKPALLTDVRTAGHFKQLSGPDTQWSVRVFGDYRALLEPDGSGGGTAVRIEHRSDVYKKR